MGIVDGEVVATHKVMPARRPSKIILWADNEGTETIADGSDLITVIAAIADEISLLCFIIFYPPIVLKISI